MGKFLVSISFFINIIHQILAHLLNSGKHGRSNRLHNQKMTTYVSTSVFQAIQKLFPNAITLPVVITDGQFETCSECSREKSYMAHLPGKLLNLVASNEKIFELSNHLTTSIERVASVSFTATVFQQKWQV